MPKPSLNDFMAPAPAPSKPDRATKPMRGGEELVTLSLRITRSEWEQLLVLTTSERTKIQPYLRELIEADFRRRGLRYGTTQ